ncbi:addiction module antitoxin, RelB/DinJ family [Blautia hydrogenotrophica DSM 10507]|uniref:Addiction module antitoxin, RelB/DinJ family n=2 Tax=Blautia hydrogenotrophica TaxID=53443 RepID=C0CKW1_BLAHS|nr:addiction module antitoxin, RelB/DinJ family [Blautia hydrogenotrophica DSM 10507]
MLLAIKRDIIKPENQSEVIIMARTASRTANVYTRVDPETKEQAEAILNQLGIPMSNAIGMFLKQVVLHRGIPFDMRLPAAKPVAIGGMTKEQIDMELQKGMDDIAAGRVVSADEVDAEMRRLYGI